MPDDPSIKDFGASFKGFMDQMAREAPKEEPYFRRRLLDHFGADPSGLSSVQERLEFSDHPNLQVALEAYLAESGRTAELLGVHTASHYGELTFAQLSMKAEGGMFSASATTHGPVLHSNIKLGGGEVLACVKSGLYLIREGEQRSAVLVSCSDEFSFRERLTVEVMAPTRALSEATLGTLRRGMQQRNVFRGHVVSLQQDERTASIQMNFHKLPEIARDAIVLPAGLLERIERETVEFARHSERLRASGQHLRRGLLLHGPPGTGKTLTAMYLAGRMPECTVILLTGRSLGLIERSCHLARMLQPSIVVLEDVDLVAEDRTRPNCASPILFELLNQMDGLGEDARILFLLTTNRPDLLEPALAARPGRVDQALEIPLPDADCRRRLLALYSQGLKLELERREEFVGRTAKASAAFIRELVRKSALLAALGAEEIVVKDEHLDAALRELLAGNSLLTRNILGFQLAEPSAG